MNNLESPVIHQKKVTMHVLEQDSRVKVGKWGTDSFYPSIKLFFKPIDKKSNILINGMRAFQGGTSGSVHVGFNFMFKGEYQDDYSLDLRWGDTFSIEIPNNISTDEILINSESYVILRDIKLGITIED